MPIYDCGDPDCEECKRAFGPDRTKAIAAYHKREQFYAELGQADLSARDKLKIDDAWEKHIATPFTRDDPDWPPRVSAFDFPEGTKRRGSTGQLFHVKDRQWVRIADPVGVS
jgi:hypothetical protein